MVRYYFPQSSTGSVGVNSNFPPQSGSEKINPPVIGSMEYQEFVTMGYENFDEMEYEE